MFIYIYSSVCYKQVVYAIVKVCLTKSHTICLLLTVGSDCQEPLLREASIPIPDVEPTKKSFTIYAPNGTGSGIQILLDTK